MAQGDRLERIRQIVRLEKKVVAANLSSQFGVTPETIRHGLEKLEEERPVVRTYEGVALNQTESSEKVDLMKRSETNIKERRVIAGVVSEMVPPNTSIRCDTGSAATETLKYLSEREDILVLANSIKVIRETERSRSGILSVGGRVSRQSYSMQDGVARSTVQECHLDMVLISCKGMSMEGGISDSHELEVDVKKSLIEQGHKVYLLADHSKFGRVALIKFTGLEQIGVVVTDRKPSDEWMRLLSRNHIKVHYPQIYIDDVNLIRW